jgi:hypothetical protein
MTDQERIDPALCKGCAESLATIMEQSRGIYPSTPFRDCTALCQGIPNIFRLNFEDSSSRFDGQFFSEFIPCKGLSIEDLVGTKARIDKIVVER